MTLKEGADPPLVHASYATAEPEFDLNAPIATSHDDHHQVPPPPRPVASVNRTDLDANPARPLAQTVINRSALASVT
ncbi:hypothetical protein MHU86_3374 [Fragilaria crotonensis]|nr:hypothetical protein MHU86_3374 [Fragilaria crotonensis]